MGHRMALTDTGLKALKAKDKPYTLADERGLYVEVFPTGGMVWRYRYRLNGKQLRIATSSASTCTSV